MFYTISLYACNIKTGFRNTITGINHKNNPVFDFIKVPDAGDLNTVTQITPVQILAYQLATLRGTDPDKPRNLAKSVTVK